MNLLILSSYIPTQKHVSHCLESSAASVLRQEVNDPGGNDRCFMLSTNDVFVTYINHTQSSKYIESIPSQNCDDRQSLEAPAATYELKMDAVLAGCITRTCNLSEQFCQGFVTYVKHFAKCKNLYKSNENHRKLELSSRHDHVMPVDLMVFIQLIPVEKQWLDLKWNYRINGLVQKRVVLEDAMAWLNTLGGGFSALGDYFQHHAKEAGRISIKQLNIAMEMGDPPTVVRCYLYMSLSLMQTGQLEIAANILRYQYKIAKKLRKQDHRLLAMCKGIWSRLCYLHSLGHQLN